MTADEAIRALREDLREIAAVHGCTSCECLMAVAAQALVDVRRIPGDEARETEQDLRDILDGGRDGESVCTDCEPCLPVEPYQRFRAALPERIAAAVGPSDLGGCGGCGCDGCSG